MANGEDVLMFRLAGDVKPELVSSKDLGEILINLDDAIKAIVADTNPEYNLDELKIGLVEIIDKSEGLRFNVNLPVLVTAFMTLGGAIKKNTYDELPNKSVESLVNIQSKVKKYKCVGEFYRNDKNIATLSQEAEIAISEQIKVRGETSIYGRIERVGGADPKLRVRLFNGETHSLDVSEEFAKQAGTRLYEDVKIIGEAVWDIRNHSIISFKAKSIGEYKSISNTKAFNKLRLEVGDIWDKINDIDDLFLNK